MSDNNSSLQYLYIYMYSISKRGIKHNIAPTVL